MEAEKVNEIKVINVQEAAKMLGVSTSWIRKAVFKRTLPYLKIGKMVRFNEQEIWEWFNQNKVFPLTNGINLKRSSYDH